MNIRQQCQMLSGSAMPFDMLDPSPCNRNSSFSIWQTHDQQLMSKTDLGTIYNQTDFTAIEEMCFQPLPGNGFIPFPYLDLWIAQQSAHSANSAQQLCCSGYLSGNPIQIY